MKRLLILFLLSLFLAFSGTLPASAYNLIFTADSSAEDAFVRFASNDNTFADANFGEHPELLVGTYTDGLPSPWEHQAFIRFDLSEIPQGTAVNWAELRLFHQGGESGWARTKVGVHQVLEPWEEDLITWNSRPAFVEEPLDYRVLNDHETGRTWQNWLITSAVQSWIDGIPNYGLTLNRLQPSYPYDLQVFASSETSGQSLQPKLAMDITPPDLQEAIANRYENGGINNEGVANSLLVKIPQEDFIIQMDVPRADLYRPLINEIRAQAGKHVKEATASWLLEIIDFIEELG